MAITSATLLVPEGLGLTAEAASASLERGLVGAGLRVLPAEQVRTVLADHADLRGCVTPACLGKIAGLLRVKLCAQVRVRKLASGAFEATVLVTNAKGQTVARQRRACEQCDRAKLLSAIARLGEDVGPTALAATRAPQVTPVPKPGPRRCRVCWISGVALLGVGLVATSAGVALWALDGDEHSRTAHQKKVYDTRAGGITGTVIGVSALVTGGALLVYGLMRKQAPPVTVSVDPRRRVVAIGGRF